MSSKDISTISPYTRATRSAYMTAYGVKDVDVHTQNNIRTTYYKDKLFRILCGAFEVAIPDEWYYEYVLYNLISRGGIAVTRYRGAVIPLDVTITDYTAFHFPRTVASANGDIQINRRTVGTDCELLYLDCVPFAGFKSPLPIIDLYAAKLAMIDAGIDVNIFNTRTPWLMEAEDVKDADNLKALYTKIASGEPAIFWHKRRSSLDSHDPKITTLPVKDNYIADKLIEAKRAVIAEFREEIGLNNVEYEKKERMVTDEVNANNSAVECASARWRYNLKRCCDKINDMYDIGLKIEYTGGIYDHESADGTGYTGDLPSDTDQQG